MEAETSEIEIDDIEDQIEKLQKLKMKTIERKRKAAERAAKKALEEKASKMSFKVEAIPMFKTGQSWWRIGRHFYCSERRRRANNSADITHYLRCGDKSCPVKLKWREGTPVSMTQFRCAHNHAPQPWIIDRNKMFQALKQAVLQAGQEEPVLSDIYNTVANRYPLGKMHLPLDNVRSSMRRWLTLVVPKRGPMGNMASLDEKLRTHPYYQARYAGSVSVEGEYAIVLAMEGFGSCLSTCDTMLIDVIKDLPKPISAMLTIHSLMNKSKFTPVVILMSGESEKLFGVALGFVWSAMGVPRPQRVVAPYNDALRLALKATGITVPIQGGYFQYSQDLLRQANDMGMDVYTRSEEWEMIRLYIALALLPSHAIPQVFKNLPIVAEKNQLPFSQDFHDYFEGNWLKKNISVSRDPHRTTDVCEKFQTSIRRQLAYRWELWSFIDYLRRVLNTSSDRYVQMITLNREFHRNTARQMVVYKNKQYANDLKSGKITMTDYLVLISKNNIPLLVCSNNPGVDIQEELAEVKCEGFEFNGADSEENEPQFESEDEKVDLEDENENIETAIESEEDEAPGWQKAQNAGTQFKMEQDSFMENNDENVTDDRSNDCENENEVANDEVNNEDNEVEELEETEDIGETLKEKDNETESEDYREDLESQQVEYLDDWPESSMVMEMCEANVSASVSPSGRTLQPPPGPARTTRVPATEASHPEVVYSLPANFGPSSSRGRAAKLQHTSRGPASVTSRRSVSPSHSLISTGSVPTKRYVISKGLVSPRPKIIPKRSVSPSHSVASRRSVTSNSAVRPAVTVISKRLVTPSHSVSPRRSVTSDPLFRPAASNRPVVTRCLVTPSRSVTPIRKGPAEKRARFSARSSDDSPTQSSAGCSLCLCQQSPPSEALLHCGHMLCASCRETREVGDPCPFCDEPIEGFLRLRM